LNLAGQPITTEDYRRLLARWIERETADCSLFRRVDSQEGAEIVGRNGSGNYAGLLLPYVWPGEDRVREYRLRRDAPDIEYDANGRPKERGKYLSPPGRGNLLYFPVGVDPLWLSDAAIDLVITEGEFKTVALFRAAWHGLGESADRPRFLPVGLSGVWNWKGTVGKATNAAGARVDVKGVIPDFGRVEWKSRRVIIVFDRDLESNDKVRWARDLLAKELRRRGARVHVFPWPEVQVKGIDDYLAAAGPDIVLDLIERAPEHGSGPGVHETNFVRPVALTVDDLLELKAPERQVLIETMVPRPGAVMLMGAHKSGKTVLAVQMAIAEASGHALMDSYRISEKGPVIVIEQDDPAGDISVRDYLKVSPVPVRGVPLYLFTRIKPRFGLDFCSWLESEISGRGARLVVLDSFCLSGCFSLSLLTAISCVRLQSTLNTWAFAETTVQAKDSYTALRPHRPPGIDIVKIENEEVALLDDLGKRNSCTLLILHHISKSSFGMDWSDQAAGTFSMGAAVEAQIHIARFKDLPGNAPERIVQGRCRHLEGFEAVIRFRKQTLDYELVLEGPGAPLFVEICQLRNAFGDRIFSPRDLYQELGISRASASRLIAKLSAAGVLDRTGYGEYRLAASVLQQWRGTSK
jgi:hypothetical protein